jgi:hypothetical protein
MGVVDQEEPTVAGSNATLTGSPTAASIRAEPTPVGGRSELERLEHDDLGGLLAGFASTT